MREKLNVHFDPEKTPLSEIERKLKFINEIPIREGQDKEVKSLNKLETFKEGFNVIFKEDNAVDIIPIGNVILTYFNLEELSNLKKQYFKCDNNCLTIYSNPVNVSDSYHFFYKGEKK